MTETIDLTRLSDAGFDALYRERIEPLLHAADQERRALVGQFRGTLLIGAALAIGAGVAISFLAGNAFAGVIVGTSGLIAAYTLAYWPMRAFSAKVKAAVLSAVAEGISVGYAAGDGEYAPFRRFCDLNLLPGHDRVRFEDMFTGIRQGHPYELSEAILEVDDHDPTGAQSSVAVFRGQLVRIALAEPFRGRTIVRRATEALESEDDLQPVATSDVAFSVFSDNEEAARALASPDLLARLAAVETAFKGRHIRCAFDAGDFLLAMDSPDRFEIGDLFAPLADPVRARRIINDIGEVLTLLDAVLAARRPPAASVA